MSRLSRIPVDQSSKLNWAELMKLLSVESVSALEKQLKVSDNTFSRSEQGVVSKDHSKTRGISAKVHDLLLEEIAQQFASGEEMRRWMEKNWPKETLIENTEALDAVYQEVDIANASRRTGIFPADYVERDEEAQVLALLTTPFNKIQEIWICGLGGVGKSTLALGLIRNHLAGDYPQLNSSKGKGCKKANDRDIHVVMTVAKPCKSQ